MGKFEKFNSNLETRAIRNSKDIDQQWIIENEANELFSSKNKGYSTNDVYQKILDAEFDKKELEEIKQILMGIKDEEDYDIIDKMNTERQLESLNTTKFETDSNNFEQWVDDFIFDDSYHQRKR